MFEFIFYLLPQALLSQSPKESKIEIEKQSKEFKALTQQFKDQIKTEQLIAEELRESREMLQLALASGETGSFSWNLKWSPRSKLSIGTLVTGSSSFGQRRDPTTPSLAVDRPSIPSSRRNCHS